VFAQAGATIFSSENARKRMSGEVQTVRNGQVQPTLAKPGWPVVTFPAGIDFHLDGQTIRAIRGAAPAHTDGDVMVYFVEANVLHTGDVFVNGRYPLIDVGSGGSLKGFIAVQKQIIALAKPDTKIIPGHGELGTRADVQAELAMMEGAAAAIQARIAAGDTLEKIIAAKPLAPWQPKFPDGAPADTFVTAVYGELTKK
jgi:glyoxylase-like metal-dependent hydrolase (beta-lactamase superfamily II)